MRAKNRKLKLVASNTAGGLSLALARERRLFVARNSERCDGMVVDFLPHADQRHIVISASFAFGAALPWHTIELPLGVEEAAPQPDDAVAAAFASLDEAIGAARIAELFAPLPGTNLGAPDTLDEPF